MKIDISRLLCYRLFRVVKLNEQLIDKSMAKFQLTRTQWKIMTRLNFLPLPCSQQEMLTSMGIDRAHLTRTLEQLENRGLLKRERVTEDKRAYNISLTKTGLNLLNEIENILSEYSHLLASRLSRIEKEHLNKALEKMEFNITSMLRGFNEQESESDL